MMLATVCVELAQCHSVTDSQCHTVLNYELRRGAWECGRGGAAGNSDITWSGLFIWRRRRPGVDWRIETVAAGGGWWRPWRGKWALWMARARRPGGGANCRFGPDASVCSALSGRWKGQQQATTTEFSSRLQRQSRAGQGLSRLARRAWRGLA